MFIVVIERIVINFGTSFLNRMFFLDTRNTKVQLLCHEDNNKML